MKLRFGGFLCSRSDLGDGSGLLVLLPRRRSDGLPATPWVGAFGKLSRARCRILSWLTSCATFSWQFAQLIQPCHLLAVVRWCCGVFNGPFLCKGLEFTGCKLAALIGYQLLGDTITRQARLKLFYHSWWFGVDELIQFPEVWFAADGNKILFVMMGEEVCSDFLPCSFRHFMRHKCLFAGCLFILSARPILLIPYSCLAKRHVP